MSRPGDSASPPRSTWWSRVPGVYKALSALVSVALAGAVTHAYAARFATRTELSEDVVPLRVRVEVLERDVAVTRAAAETLRNQVAGLVQHLLANPPGRHP